MKHLWRKLADSWKGHWSFGPVTIYGANAMHWAINIRLRRLHTLCVHPTTRCGGGYWPWYVYMSLDCTPSTAWWGFGPGFRCRENSPEERAACRERRMWCN